MKTRTRSRILSGTLLLTNALAAIDPSTTESTHASISPTSSAAPENKSTQTDASKKIQTPEESPLYIAAKEGDCARVQQLLKTANAKELSGTLAVAAKYNQKKIILMLLREGANPNENNGEPLQNAAEYGRGAIVKILLKNGAKPTCGTLSKAVSAGSLNIVKMVLQAGANPNELDGSPLEYAAEKGHTKIAQVLLAWKATPDGLNPFMAPLHFAAEKGYDKIVRLLIQAGAKVNILAWGFAGTYRETPLHKAARAGHVACAQKLLAAGADINLKDSGDFNKTALAKTTNQKMIQFLREHCARD